MEDTSSASGANTMTAQQARIGGKFLSLDRSQSTERAIPEEAQEGRTTHPATAPLIEYLSVDSALDLLYCGFRLGPLRYIPDTGRIVAGRGRA